jgi:hypothetical protein
VRIELTSELALRRPALRADHLRERRGRHDSERRGHEDAARVQAVGNRAPEALSW